MIADTMNTNVTDCEAARLAFDDPWERLCEVVANEDQYEIDSLIRECADILAELQDACGNLAVDCDQRRSASRSDVRLIEREMATLIRELKSISRSGVEGEELQDRMDDWNDSFEDWDSSLNDILDAVRTEA